MASLTLAAILNFGHHTKSRHFSLVFKLCPKFGTFGTRALLFEIWSLDHRCLRSSKSGITWSDKTDARFLDDGQKSSSFVGNESHRFKAGLMVLDGARVELGPEQD